MLPFGYAWAQSVSDAIDHLLKSPAAMPIAGGTDMLQLMQESVLAPVELIDLNRLPLRGISETADVVRIGALARLSEVIDDTRIRLLFPALAEALAETASPQVRNMASVGGNLLQRTRCSYFRDIATPCNKRRPGSGCPARAGQNRMSAIFGGSEHCIAAYPGDMANALLVLDAEIETEGTGGVRRIKAEQLHRRPGDTPQIETVLEPGEIITAIVLPRSAHAANSHYLKVRDRASFAWPLVSAAAAIAIENGVVAQARVAAGGVGTTPWRLTDVERALCNHRLDEAAAITAAEAATRGADPRPGNRFKMKLLRRTVTGVLLKAIGPA